eukprot:TRINITY_DN30090_c0_g1_i1.p1 TRINITY_DN30090_c0_g1~~TRINITY_DN30090_c0_g1_i1.p1  ORF type:complete len:144 (-),score=15.39 TRINITY_DN30090_c0_g1_i1:462-893(-)
MAMQLQFSVTAVLPRHSVSNAPHFGQLPVRAAAHSSSYRMESALSHIAVPTALLSRMVCRKQRARRVVIRSVAGKGDYADLVAENRMITIAESNLRYAGAFIIALIGVYNYVGMQAVGVFDYTAIAANAAGAWILFETGRQSI